jgi:MOSC domain-containing protein YiiM
MRDGARVLSVNVGRPRTVEWHGRQVRSAIWKEPVAGRLRVEGVLVEGDAQADLRVHGGPTKSVYAYAAEDYRWWSDQVGEELGPGAFGDNLTIEGIDPARTVIGERWGIGSAVLRVTEPRIPCFKLGIRMGDAGFVDRFAEAGRSGTYLAIEEAGELGAGDEIRRLHTPAHGVTVGDVERAHNAEVERARKLLDVADLSDDWRSWASKALRRAGISE